MKYSKGLAIMLSLLWEKNVKQKIALTLIGIIQEDESIDCEEKEIFRVFLGLINSFFQQTVFLFSELLGKTLLYVVNSDIKNTMGKIYIEVITEKYIAESFATFQLDYAWKADCDTFILYSYEMLNCFNGIISNNKIDVFIQQIDPTIQFYWDYYDDRINEFHSDKYNLKSETL